MKNALRKQKLLDRPAQAMIEFAIVAPILFLMLFGVFEVGRMVFLYAAVTNASREAVRYGSAVGYDDLGQIKYKNCAGIRDLVRRASLYNLAQLPDANITITYDHGPGTAVFHTCTGTVDPGFFIKSEDRILVTVTAHYVPYTSLVPWGERDIVSSSARTILGYVALGGTPSSTPAPTSTTTVTETSIASATATGPTETPSDTPTATDTAISGPFYTLPPAETATLADTATPADTQVPTLPYETETPAPETPSETPTPETPTATPECVVPDVSTLAILNKTMSTTITNPNNFAITIAGVGVKWNATDVALIDVSLGGNQLWSGQDTSGLLGIPNLSLTVNGSSTSTMTFTFSENYINYSGTAVILNVLVPECGAFEIITTPS